MLGGVTCDWGYREAIICREIEACQRYRCRWMSVILLLESMVVVLVVLFVMVVGAGLLHAQRESVSTVRGQEKVTGSEGRSKVQLRSYIYPNRDGDEGRVSL